MYSETQVSLGTACHSTGSSEFKGLTAAFCHLQCVLLTGGPLTVPRVSLPLSAKSIPLQYAYSLEFTIWHLWIWWTDRHVRVQTENRTISRSTRSNTYGYYHKEPL